MATWLMTIAQLPTEDPAARMRVLRTLESLGAAVMREGAYLLPDSAANRQALAEADGAVKKLRFAAQSPASLASGESFLRRTWATRRPPSADRLACAWLVRRFVDPEATLAWLEKADEVPAGALGFAFDGAH